MTHQAQGRKRDPTALPDEQWEILQPLLPSARPQHGGTPRRVDMRDAPSREKAEKRRDAIVEQYAREFPQLCRCLLDDADTSLNYLEVPQRHQQYVRPSNLAERAFVEERRRPKVIPHLSRVSDRWNKQCFSLFEQHQIRSLRGRLKLDEQEVKRSDPFVHVSTRRSAASAA